MYRELYLDMSGKRIRFSDYDVDFGRRELRKRGIRVGLQHKPFRVLEVLLRRPGELVTREELVSVLWPDSHVSFEHGLNTAVNSLRQALGESSRDCRFIETRPGIGYRFCAPVEVITETSANSTASQGAKEDYVKGRYFLDRMCEEEAYKAIAFFRSAASDDSCHALAHAGIADAYCQLALLGSASLSQLAREARSSAERALKKDPGLAEAQVSAGRVKVIFDWEFTGAHEAAHRALEIAPNSASSQSFQAWLLCTSGRHEEASRFCGQVLALDPLSFPANMQSAVCLFGLRDYKGVADQCWKILTLSPTFAPAQLLLALAYEQLEMYDDALVEYQNAQSCVGFRAAATSGMGHVFAITGLDSEAERAFGELSRQAAHGYVSNYWHAVVCAGRRQDSQALYLLEESVQHHDPALLSLNADPRFDRLREHDRFHTILQSIGLSSER